MVFGVFDGLHPGHRFLVEQARTCGDELIVVVARDIMVQLIKEKLPRENQETRRKNIGELKEVTQAILGDTGLGVYQVIHDHEPHIICLGYDQDGLQEDLERAEREGTIPRIERRRLESHHPEKYRSSLWQGEE